LVGKNLGLLNWPRGVPLPLPLPLVSAVDATLLLLLGRNRGLPYWPLGVLLLLLAWRLLVPAYCDATEV
jgi:hypothetical protein